MTRFFSLHLPRARTQSLARLRRRPLFSTTTSTVVRSFWSVHSDTGVISFQKEPRFQTIIGLEIHAQLNIPTKLFSSAAVSTSLSQAPNTLVHPFDVAVPGFLPQCSKSAVRAAILTAAALQCEIATVSRFERKHYHYADLPFGYQVTQQRWPIAKNGTLSLSSAAASVSPSKKKAKKSQQKQKQEEPITVGIDRIQLEQDTGKTTTSTTLTKEGRTATRSMVDFNRAGCALVEIVMNPDIRSSKQAVGTVETLRQLFKHIGTCNGRMEEGSLRVDLNVSIHPLDTVTSFVPNPKNRVEVKNLNSLRQVQQAAEYEAIRQAETVWEDHGATFQETRTFHVKSGKTVLIRSKEGEEDYRFMPEPDLPPVVLNEEILEGLSLEDFLASNLPELPEAARDRLKSDYNLDEYTASVIAGDPPAIRLYDEAVTTAREHLSSNDDGGDNDTTNKLKEVPETVAKFLCNDLFSLIREDEERRREREGEISYSPGSDSDLEYSHVTGPQLGELIAMLLQGTISTTMAKKLLILLYQEEIGQSPTEVAQRHGLQLISDADELQRLCRETLDQHPDQLEQYRKGGKHVIKMKKFLVGKAMAHSRGNAHPERLHEALEDVLEEVAPDVQ